MPHVFWPTLSCRTALLWMEYILENAYLTIIARFILLRFKQQEFTYRKNPFVIIAFFGLKNIVAMLFNIMWYVFLDMNTWMHVCVYIYTLYMYIYIVPHVSALAAEMVLWMFALTYFCRSNGALSLNYPHPLLCSQVLKSPGRPSSDLICDPVMGSLTDV